MNCAKRITGLTVLCVWFVVAFTSAQTLINERLATACDLSNSEPESAFILATEILEESKTAKQDDLIGEVQVLRGKILFQFGLFQQASEALYEAERIFQSRSNQLQLAAINNLLGEVYYKFKSPEEALQRHNVALRIYQRLGNSAGEAETISFIGSMFEKTGLYAKALKYQNKSLEKFEALGLTSNIALVRENIGSIYEDLELYDSAYSNFEQAFVMNTASGDSLRIISNLNNLGDVLRKTHHPEEGLLLSKRAAAMSQRLGNLYQQRSATVDIAKSYADMMDYQNAFEFLEQSRQLSDLLFSEEYTRQLAIQEVQYNLFTKNQEINELEQRQVFDSKVKWLLVFLVSLLCTLGWVIFNRQKLKIENNKELLKQQEEILRVKEQLLQTEQQNLKLLELKMKAEDRAHSKSLTAQTLHVIDKNQMLDDIQNRLKRILEDDPKEQKKKIRNLIKQIDFNFAHDTDWEDFKQSFEKVHQDFFVNIQNHTGGLTPAELKLASLMRLNLNSKEVASSLGISMDSLRISRYRLRKKLKLEKGDSLQHFLLCL